MTHIKVSVGPVGATGTVEVHWDNTSRYDFAPETRVDRHAVVGPILGRAPFGGGKRTMPLKSKVSDLVSSCGRGTSEWARLALVDAEETTGLLTTPIQIPRPVPSLVCAGGAAYGGWVVLKILSLSPEGAVPSMVALGLSAFGASVGCKVDAQDPTLG